MVLGVSEFGHERRLYRKPYKTEIAFIGQFASKSALAKVYGKE